MRYLARFLVAVLALVVTVRAASAQSWCNSPGRQASSYLDCALRVEGDRLQRGGNETVALADRITGLPLRRFVAGDSAQRHAALYERAALRAGTVRLAGGALLIAGSIVTLTHRNGPPGERGLGSTGARLMLSGVSIHLLSIPLQRRADREVERAVWWNNAGLRREP